MNAILSSITSLHNLLIVRCEILLVLGLINASGHIGAHAFDHILLCFQVLSSNILFIVPIKAGLLHVNFKLNLSVAPSVYPLMFGDLVQLLCLLDGFPLKLSLRPIVDRLGHFACHYGPLALLALHHSVLGGHRQFYILDQLVLGVLHRVDLSSQGVTGVLVLILVLRRLHLDIFLAFALLIVRADVALCDSCSLHVLLGLVVLDAQ